MINSDELIDEQKMYVNGKNSLNAVLSYLKNSINKLDVLLEESSNAYKVDGFVLSSSFLTNIREKQNNIYNNIVRNIIPSIDSKIDDLKYDIIDAKQQESIMGSEEI